MNRIHGLVYEHNGVKIMSMCLDGDHDNCNWEKGRGSYRHENGSRNWTDSHDSAWCQCPCHDKRTSNYRILKRKFKMNIQEYLNAGHKGVRNTFDWTFYYLKKKGITNTIESCITE